MRKSIAATGVLALVAAAAACGGSDPAGKPVSGGTFTQAIPSDPGSLDILHSPMAATQLVIAYAYNTLIDIDAKGEVRPYLAEKWDVTPSSVTYTLKPGITCGDGTPLTASDVARNFTYIADAKNAAVQLGGLVTAGTTAVADEAARTVTVTSPTPDSFLLVKSGNVFIICAKGIANPDSLKTTTDGTGLYKLTEAVPNDHYTFAKRDDYTWGTGGVTSTTEGLPDTAVVRIVPNETTAANLLLTGEINAAQVAGPDRQRMERQKLFQQGGYVPVGELAFNEQKGRPGADEKVRRALAMALNIEEIRTVLTDGKGTVPTSLATLAGKAGNPCMPDTAPWTLPPLDPAGAATLLDEAGWAKGPDGVRVKDGKRLTMSFIYETNVSSTYPAAAELLSKAWTALGVEVKISGQPSTALNDTLFKNTDWDAGWIALRVFVPSTLVPFLSGATPPNGLNYQFIDNPDYVRNVTQAPALAGAASCAKWVAAEAALVNRVDVVPMADNLQPVFGSGATFRSPAGGIVADTIRMLG